MVDLIPFKFVLSTCFITAMKRWTLCWEPKRCEKEKKKPTHNLKHVIGKWRPNNQTSFVCSWTSFCPIYHYDIESQTILSYFCKFWLFKTHRNIIWLPCSSSSLSTLCAFSNVTILKWQKKKPNNPKHTKLLGHFQQRKSKGHHMKAVPVLTSKFLCWLSITGFQT